jgi:hypothetical protein
VTELSCNTTERKLFVKWVKRRQRQGISSVRKCPLDSGWLKHRTNVESSKSRYTCEVEIFECKVPEVWLAKEGSSRYRDRY